MKKIISHSLIVIFLICSTTVFSHQPNQMTYNFKLNKEESTLIIHFTPKTVIDILEFIKPELKDSVSINLYAHKEEVYNYFSERILLNKKRLKGRFSIGEINLISHDAFITFVLDDSIDFSDNLQIKISSLTDIYNRSENFVFINHLELKSRYVLSNKKRIIIWNNPETLKGKDFIANNSSSFWTLSLLSLFLIGLSVIFLTRKRPNEVYIKR